MKRNLFTSIFSAAAFAVAISLSMTISAQVKPDTSPRNQQAAAVPTPTPAATPPVIKEEDEIYKVETELVNLNVRVVDRNNRPISDLRQADFKILEDNVPQAIEFFSKSEVPTNYSLVIDNSGSMRTQIEQVIEAGKILIGNNRATDETSIIRFVSSDKIEILQEFTPNKTDLNDALESLFIEGGQTAITDAVYLAATLVSTYEKGKDNLDRKRRALVLVSDGEDVNSYYNQQQLFDLLKETDVQIYVVGFVEELSKEGGFITKSKQSKAKSFLEKLATDTGGRSYFPKSISELNGIAKDIADELRVQYSIGYVPSNDKTDGTFRNIKVSVDDGPNKQKRIAITKAGRVAEGNPPDSNVRTAAPIQKN